MTAPTVDPWPLDHRTMIRPQGTVIAAAALALPNAVHGPAREAAAVEHGPAMDEATRAQVGDPAGALILRRCVPTQLLVGVHAARAVQLLLERMHRGPRDGATEVEVVDCHLSRYSLPRASLALGQYDSPLAGVLLVCRPARQSTRTAALS